MRKRANIGLWTLALIALGAALTALFQPRDRWLLSRAARLTDIKAHDGYLWLSNQEIMIARNRKEPPVSGYWTVFRRNVVTGTDFPATRLTTGWFRRFAAANLPWRRIGPAQGKGVSNLMQVWLWSGSSAFVVRNPLPADLFVQSIVRSDDHSKVAWFAQEKKDTYTWPASLQWLERMMRPRRKGAYSLWVSRPDGRDLRSLGSMAPLTGKRRKRGDPPELPTALCYTLQWRPDGKALSFAYKGTIYVLSAD